MLTAGNMVIRQNIYKENGKIMKVTMNFSLSYDDMIRFSSAEELRDFYRNAGCDGLEVMPLEPDMRLLVLPDMAVGIHLCCPSDWMRMDREQLLAHYRQNLETARTLGAEYVVFHVTQVSPLESFTYVPEHTDEEVILATADLVNELLSEQEPSFWFLMENLWWPGLNFRRPEMTYLLLESIHYQKKGLMLDTGHFLHTNHKLRTQEEALLSLNQMLDEHEAYFHSARTGADGEDFLAWIHGIHLQQSLTGAYVEDCLTHPHILSDDPMEQMNQLFTHIFAIDKHQPFTAPGVRELVERIQPEYVTLEYITESREQLAEYLSQGMAALKNEKIFVNPLTNWE